LTNQFTINKISVFSIPLSHAVAEATLCFGAGFYEGLYVDGDFAFVAAVAVFGVEFAEVVLVDAAGVFGAGVGGGRTVGLVDAFGCGLEDGVLVLVLGLFFGDAG
jgi:hypothetical protein